MEFEVDYAFEPLVLPPDREVAPTEAKKEEFVEAAKKLYDDVAPSTGQVVTEKGTGSGFFVEDDVLVTDFHVVQDSRVQKVLTTDGKVYQARIEKIDDVNDLAYLRLDGAKAGNYTPLKLDTDIEAGERAFAFGHPRGSLRVAVSPGVVHGISTQLESITSTRTMQRFDALRQQKNRTDRLMAEIRGRLDEFKEEPPFDEQWRAKAESLPEEWKANGRAWLNAPTIHGLIDVKPGNSGGPLTDDDGEVIGVARLTETYDNAASSFTPASVVKDFIEKPESKFKFNYEMVNVSPVVGLYSNAPITMGVATGGASALAYRVAARRPKTAGVMAIGLGAINLHDDIVVRPYLTAQAARFQNSVEIGADALTTGGGIAALARRSRKLGLIFAGVGLASRLAAEFIPTETRLESIERLDGTKLPPFDSRMLGVQ